MQRILFVFIAATLVCLLGEQCVGQTQQLLTQADLRRFTEQALRDRLVYVDAPDISRPRITQTARVLRVYMGDYAPQNISSNDLLNQAISTQFQVTIIRTYRNRRGMVRWWAPTLAKVEKHIGQMLDVIYASNLTREEKLESLGQIEFAIDAIYQKHFEAWANLEGLRNVERVAREGIFEVKVVTVPPDAQVQYVSAGRWKLHQLLKQRDPNTPEMEWEVAHERELYIAGKFFFLIRFGQQMLPVIGPIRIERRQTLTFTKKGLQR